MQGQIFSNLFPAQHALCFPAVPLKTRKTFFRRIYQFFSHCQILQCGKSSLYDILSRKFCNFSSTSQKQQSPHFDCTSYSMRSSKAGISLPEMPSENHSHFCLSFHELREHCLLIIQTDCPTHIQKEKSFALEYRGCQPFMQPKQGASFMLIVKPTHKFKPSLKCKFFIFGPTRIQQPYQLP